MQLALPSVLIAHPPAEASDLLLRILDAASHITTPIRLAAFAIAVLAILLVLVHIRTGAKNPPRLAWGVIAIVILAVAPFIADTIIQSDARLAIYRLRVTVLDATGLPASADTVWSSVGGEPKHVAGGWEFDIPVQTVPHNRVVTLYASHAKTCERGTAQTTVGSDLNPSVPLTLTSDTTAQITGTVRDEANANLAGATVSVDGYADHESVVTNALGAFRLPAHATSCEQVRLHAEKAGYDPADEYAFAGRGAASLTLRHKHRPPE
ncbi:MAG TPA: carboxypeptidase-like regulatory domain-containing protein [Gemmatimonadaceae bacterium]|jgi:hypothetical protein|nr:carboxypeptidase-like regulatory domain-containing protein [Gemmatimonadaceae bacterium]